jgi:hypothetical protein
MQEGKMNWKETIAIIFIVLVLAYIVYAISSCAMAIAG